MTSPVRLKDSRPLPGASPWQAALRFGANYFRCSGRASRSEYFWATGMLVAGGMCCSLPKIRRAAALRAEAERRRAAGEDVVHDERVGAILPSEERDLLHRDSRRLLERKLQELARLGTGRKVLQSLDSAWVGLFGWGAVTLQIRRLHDADRSGWWALYGILPVVGTIQEIRLALRPSDPRGARFDR